MLEIEMESREYFYKSLCALYYNGDVFPFALSGPLYLPLTSSIASFSLFVRSMA